MKVKARSTALHLGLRMGVAMAVPCLLISLVLAKVHILQNVQGEELKARYEAQHKGRFEVKSRRGMIRDRGGRVLAGTLELDSVAIRPAEVEDRAATVGLLASALGCSRDWITAKLDSTRFFEWVERHVQPEVANRVRELNLPGVVLEKEFKRFWPQGPLAGQLLGFTDIDAKGRSGLEAAHESDLAGKTRWIDGLRDGLRQAIYVEGLLEGDRLEGRNLTLTLDSVIQQIAEEELQAGVALAGAKRGLAIVMEPQTGDILAFALAPAFDPNGPQKQPEQFVNWAVVEDFEPGSVMKVFTLAAALEANQITLDTKIDCEGGAYRIGRHTIHDHSGHGLLTALEVLTVSSNIGIAKIADRLGKEAFYQALLRMGLHGPTGCDGFTREVGGKLAKPTRWPAIQLANIAFGQGLTVTPLQLVASIGAIANGGTLMVPRLVRQIDQPGSQQGQELPPVVRGRMLRPEVAHQVTQAMVSVVYDERGTGSKARVPGFQVAGKTGTAQKVSSGRYVDRWIGTFVGFLPADRPALSIIVSMDEPEPVHYGGLVAAPVFSRIGERALTYLGIYGKPGSEGEQGLAQQAIPRAASSKSIQASGQLASTGPRPAAIGHEAADGPMIFEDPDQATDLIDEGWLKQVAVPELRGLSMLNALAQAERAGLLVELQGSGQAIRQAPVRGELVAPGSRVLVVFAETAAPAGAAP